MQKIHMIELNESRYFFRFIMVIIRPVRNKSNWKYGTYGLFTLIVLHIMESTDSPVKQVTHMI